MREFNVIKLKNEEVMYLTNSDLKIFRKFITEKQAPFIKKETKNTNDVKKHNLSFSVFVGIIDSKHSGDYEQFEKDIEKISLDEILKEVNYEKDN